MYKINLTGFISTFMLLVPTPIQVGLEALTGLESTLYFEFLILLPLSPVLGLQPVPPCPVYYAQFNLGLRSSDVCLS